MASGSAAEALGIIPGDALLSIGGEPVHDLIDYMFLLSQGRMQMELAGVNGEKKSVSLALRKGEDLGLGFETALMSRPRTCANACPFCFVDQLPEGTRPSLRVKDDDWRESFLMGNYVTLTNVSDAEFGRICSRRVQPLFLSVHAFTPSVQTELLGNLSAPKLWERMRALKDEKLSFHAQVVLCPGINDGEELSLTLDRLSELEPALQSVAVVPVGLTAHRKGLAGLTPFGRDTACGAISRVEAFAQRRRAGATRLAFASDELYLRAELPIPAYEEYEDFPQVENGVGMLRLLEAELEDAADGQPHVFKGAIATGADAAPFLRDTLERLKCDAMIVPVRNAFLGESITVAGLMCGEDIARAFENGAPERILLPASCLRGGELLLDDMTLAGLGERLNTSVVGVPVRGDALFAALADR